MAVSRCPGQDRSRWRSEDVFESPCPGCGAPIEFWKDEPRRRCRRCGRTAFNPRFDPGCAAWCPMAGDCLGFLGGSAKAQAMREEIREQARRQAADADRHCPHPPPPERPE